MDWKLVKEAQDKQRAKEVERYKLLLTSLFTNPNRRQINDDMLNTLDR